MNLTAFTDTTILKNLLVSIDEEEILAEDHLSTEIHWDGTFIINGTMIINDNVDWGNLLPLNGTNKIQLYSADIYDDYYFRTFIITSVKEIKYQNKFKAFEFTFQDLFSYEMMNTYISKSFKDVLISDIIEEFFTEFKWDELLDTNMTRTFSNTTEIKDFIVVPQDRTFYDFIMYELHREGFILYQTRNEILLKHYTDLLPSLLTTLEYEYTQLHPRAEYGFKIHEYKSVINDIGEQNKKSPNKTVYYYDSSTKSFGTYNKELSDVYTGIKINTLDTSNVQTTNGSKIYSQISSTDDAIVSEMQNVYQSNSLVEIIVPGNYLYSKIHQNVSVILSGNIANTKAQNEGDIHTSGLYTCIGVTDRILSGKLIQRLTLNRVDFQEN